MRVFLCFMNPCCCGVWQHLSTMFHAHMRAAALTLFAIGDLTSHPPHRRAFTPCRWPCGSTTSWHRPESFRVQPNEPLGFERDCQLDWIGSEHVPAKHDTNEFPQEEKMSKHFAALSLPDQVLRKLPLTDSLSVKATIRRPAWPGHHTDTAINKANISNSWIIVC